MKAISPRPFGLAGVRLPVRFLTACVLFCLGLAGSAQVVRPFNLVFTTTKPGDIAIIGNTLHTSPNPAVRNNSAATNLLINNENFMMRVDVDSDTNTFTSSSADFTLPSGGSVMFAKLYWGAGTNLGNNTATGAPNAGLRGQVLLSFNGGAYVSITNTSLDAEPSGNRYQGAREITEFVRTNGSGMYQVANVQSSTGSNTLAGWSIAIAYADPMAPPRNLSLFDGYAVVQGTQTVSIPLSGFTTPQFNAVNTRVGVVGYEGDSGLAGGVYTGDQMRLNSTHLPFPSDPFTPTNDVFNSTISRLGTRVSTKNPDYTNQLGFDLKVINAVGVLTNNATSANITLTTGGESYYPGVVTFATELYAPNISIPKAVFDVNGGTINPTDELLYTISVTNSGGDWATNVLLIDPLPANTTYVPNTFQITSGTNAGAKTDLAGDDEMEFTNGVLTVRLGLGATATNGGVISTNQSTSMSFMVRVNPNALHDTQITNQATLSSYTGTPVVQINGANAGAGANGLTLASSGSTIRGLAIHGFSGSGIVITSGSSNTSEFGGNAPVGGLTDLVVVKSGPTSTFSLNNLTYTINVTNNGPAAAVNVEVSDTLPAAVTFVSASSGGVLSNGVVTWPVLASLASGARTNYTVTVTAPVSGSITNFASGTTETIDPNPTNNNGTATNAQVITAAPAVFNPQTGLFEERVTVTNIGLSTIAATRLYVSNVSNVSTNVTFHNPSGTSGGLPYAQYNAPLNPGQTVVFTLEFLVPNRRPFTNTLTLEAVLPATTGTNSGAGLNISRSFIDTRQPGNPRYVIEFPTTPGRVYTILYSDNLTTWKVATPSVTASANSTQWYDDGPPKTESKPLTNGSRYYRVVVAPQP